MIKTLWLLVLVKWYFAIYYWVLFRPRGLLSQFILDLFQGDSVKPISFLFVLFYLNQLILRNCLYVVFWALVIMSHYFLLFRKWLRWQNLLIQIICAWFTFAWKQNRFFHSKFKRASRVITVVKKTTLFRQDATLKRWISFA